MMKTRNQSKGINNRIDGNHASKSFIQNVEQEQEAKEVKQVKQMLAKETMKKRSQVWDYFQEKTIEGANYGVCLRCPERQKYKVKLVGAYTTNMRRHLQGKHKISLTKKHKLTQKNFQYLMIRDVCLCFLPLSCIQKCEAYKLLADFHNLKFPSNRQAFTTILRQFYREKKLQFVSKNKQKLEKGFVLSIDGTSIRTRRFLNIFAFISDKEVLEFPLIRQHQSSTADNIEKEIMRLFDDFNINKSSIIGLVTDSGTNMRKLAANLKIQNQRCVIHLIHNCIIKFINRLPEKQKQMIQQQDNQSDDQSQQQYQQIINMESQFYQSQQSNQSSDQPERNMIQILKKVRKTCCLIRKSSVLYDKLRKLTGNPNSSIVIDVKTRWSSTYFMVRKYLKLEESIRLILEENGPSLILQGQELQELKVFYQTLEIIESAQLLIQQKKDIINCELIVDTLLSMLGTRKDFYSNEFSDIFYNKYKQIRNVDLLSCGLYLQKQASYKSIFQQKKFPLRSIPQIESLILERFPVDVNQNCKKGDEDESMNIFSKKIRQRFGSQKTSIEIQLQNYRTSNVKGQKLQQVLANIKKLRSNSVINERGFSLLGRLCNKYRGKLNDEKIIQLTFIRTTLKDQKMDIGYEEAENEEEK